MAEILDSGTRREFRDENGNLLGVRDICDGKGRCDLLPLKQISRFLNDAILCEIASYQQTHNVVYLYNALHLFCGKRYESEFDAVLELAVHFENGARKYAENNWQGLPKGCFLDSGVRHYLKWLRGDEDEPHDRSFMWNIVCLIFKVDQERCGDGLAAVGNAAESAAESISRLADVVKTAGKERGEKKRSKTFLEDFLEKNPCKTAEGVIAMKCVECYYPMGFDCTGIKCHDCWNRVMPEYISEGGED